MKQPMVVTNVRLPHSDWQQMKSIASEMGISLNQYLTTAGKLVSTYSSLFGISKKQNDPYSAMWKIIKKKTPIKPMGWSKEDEAIYSV